MLSQRQKKKIVIGFSVAFLLRLIAYVTLQPWELDVQNLTLFKGDGWGYHMLGKNLAEEGKYRSLTSQEEKESPIHYYCSLEELRPPMYPALIALIYSCFGVRPWVVVLFQTVIDSISCAFIGYYVLRYIHERYVLPSMLFYAFNPHLIRWSLRLYSETLVIFLFLVFLLLYSFFFQNTQKRKRFLILAIAGSILAVATLTKPVFFYFALIPAGFLFFSFVPSYKKAPIALLSFLLPFLLFVSLWMLRNYNKFSSFSISTVPSVNLLLFTIPVEMTEKANVSYDEIERILYHKADSIMQKEGKDITHLNDFQKEKYWRRVAMEIITNKPFSFFKAYIFGAVKSLITLESYGFASMFKPQSATQINIREHTSLKGFIIDFFSRKSLLEIIIAFYVALYLSISYISLFFSLRDFRKYPWQHFFLFALLCFGYFLVVSAPAGRYQYILPGIVCLVPFMGVGITNLVDYLMKSVKQ